MRVLALNSGSSSLRWGLFADGEEAAQASGAVEEVHDAGEAWRRAEPELAGLAPDAVGHRVVHGGERFTEAARVDDSVMAAIDAVAPLAPAHNPRSLAILREARRLFPDVPQVAVFDTAFHQSLPPSSYLYPLPYSHYAQDRIRRYGFHGTSHRYAAERAAELLDVPKGAYTGISCHLGNGCSIAAVRDGRCVDTSMGMTPLEGLMMGTRSGDPAVVLQLARRFGVERAEAILQEESGLLGVSGVSSDLREVEDAAEAGNERAALALALFAHRVRRGIGAALAVLGGAQALVFTGGIGVHGEAMRERILDGLEGLGIGSRTRVLVVPAREEWLIARETAAVLAADPEGGA